MIVVYTSLVGDLFHVGHLNLLRRAKELGDYLIVGVLTDEAVAEYKRKPIVSTSERMEIIKAIKYVDEVILQHSRDGADNLRKMNANILVRGNDAMLQDEVDYIQSNGGKFIQLERTPGVSTTETIKNITKRAYER